MSTRRRAALVLLAALPLHGCAASRRAWDMVKPRPEAAVLDARALAKVTHVLILPGETDYPSAQARLIAELEGALKTRGGWSVMGPSSLKKELDLLPLPPPASMSRPPAGLHQGVLERLPRRDERVAILSLWVESWEGERWRELDPVKDIGEVAFDAVLAGVFGGKPAETYSYHRGVAAQLIDSRDGVVLWRARRSWTKTEKLEEATRLVPFALQETREAETAKETAEFRDFVADGLAGSRDQSLRSMR